MKRILPLHIAFALLLLGTSCTQPQQITAPSRLAAGELEFVANGFGFSPGSASLARVLNPAESDYGAGSYVSFSELTLTDGDGTVSVVPLGFLSSYASSSWKPTALIPAGTYTAVLAGFNYAHVKVSQSDAQVVEISETSKSLSFYCRPHQTSPTSLVVGATVSEVTPQVHTGDYKSWSALEMSGLKAETVYQVTVQRSGPSGSASFAVSSDAGLQSYRNLSWSNDTATFRFPAQFRNNSTFDLILLDYSSNAPTSYSIQLTETSQKVNAETVAQRFLTGTKGPSASDRPGLVKADLTVSGLSKMAGTRVRLTGARDRWGWTPFGSLSFSPDSAAWGTVSPEGVLAYTFYYVCQFPSSFYYYSDGGPFWGDADAGVRFEAEEYPLAVLKAGKIEEQLADTFFIRSAKIGVKNGDSISLTLKVGDTAYQSATGFRYFTTWGRAAKIQENPDGTGVLTIIVPPEAQSKVSRMVPDFAVEEGAVVTLGNEVQTPRRSVVDFTQPLVYTVTSQDKFQVRTYSVVIKNEVQSLVTQISFYGLIPNAKYELRNENGAIASMTANSSGVGRSALNQRFSPSQASWELWQNTSNYEYSYYYNRLATLPAPDGVDDSVARTLSFHYLPIYNPLDPSVPQFLGFTDRLSVPLAETELGFNSLSPVQTLPSTETWYGFTPTSAFAQVGLQGNGSTPPAGLLIYNAAGALLDPIATLTSSPLALSPGESYRLRLVNLFPAYGGNSSFQILAGQVPLASRITFVAGDSPASVKNNLSLPLDLGTGWTATWSSDQPGVISPSGQVTRPAEGESDAVVKLTANLVNGPLSDVLSVDVTVKAFPLGGEGGLNLGIEKPLLLTVDLQSYPSDISSGSSKTVYAYPSQTVDSYSWYLDGQPLKGQSGSSVTLSPPLTVGRHSLFLLVTKGGVLATATHDFTVLAPVTSLTFQDPTRISLSMSSLPETIQEGTNLSIWSSSSVSCEAFQWYVDGLPVVGQNTWFFSSVAKLTPGRHTLSVTARIGSLWFASSGSFTVIPQSAATVEVTDPAQAYLHITNISSPVASGMSLWVYASSNLSPDSYQWYIDGIPVGTGYSFNLPGFLASGRHSLMVLARKDTAVLTDTSYFTVQ